MAEKTVLQTFTDLNHIVSDAEQDLSDAVHGLQDARKRLDELAAQFGFVTTPPLPAFLPRLDQ